MTDKLLKILALVETLSLGDLERLNAWIEFTIQKKQEAKTHDCRADKNF